MNGGSWPYFPAQCPDCLYLDPDPQAYLDDSGYEIVGFCRHPRIAMELFRPQQRCPSPAERCPLFIWRGAE
jgi:hypothetical protein